MIEHKKTDREKSLEKDVKDIGWDAVVVNFIDLAKIETKFSSDFHTLDQVAHKIKLDLMSDLKERKGRPIAIVIKPKNVTLLN